MHLGLLKSRWLRLTLLAGHIGWLAPPACAGELPGGVQLGMSAQDVQHVVPGLRRLPHPAHLARGVVGCCAGAAVDVAGVALTPTFFFAGGKLRRVEYLAAADAGPSAFDALLQWGRAAWGAELASQNPEGSYATWADDGLDMYLQRTSGQAAPEVRLVIRERVLKDGSEL